MQDSVQSEIEHLMDSIDYLETQRSVLGNEAVDLTIHTLRERIRALDPTQQRKLATILMMDIADSTLMTRFLDSEENAALIEPAMMRIKNAVVEFGGLITRFTGDGFKAIFGLPDAHDNDAEMAVRAALSIQQSARDYARELAEQRGIADFRVRVGLDTGWVFIGGPSEGEKMVKGMPVTTAARLQSAASPGGILISTNTQRLVRGLFEIEPLEPLTLKGLPEPVEAYLIKGSEEEAFLNPTRGVIGVTTSLVGRMNELNLILAAYQAAAGERQPKMVTALAEAGVGKSRLMYEFELGLEPGVNLYKGRSLRERQHLPYGLFRNLFTRRLGIRENDTPEETLRIFEAEFEQIGFEDGEGTLRAHYAGQLLGFDFSSSPILQNVHADAEQVSERGRNYLIEYFSRAADGGLCALFMEDIHWADEQSLDLLEELVTILAGQPFFIFCNARPELIERRSSWCITLPACQLLRLPPLSDQESRHLVAEILKRAATIPLVLREFIVKGAEGNPYYIEELINMLLDKGVIIREGDQLLIDQAQVLVLEVPPTITGIVQARLDQLETFERNVIQQAAVVGRQFWDGVLFQINANTAGESADGQIRAALEALVKKEMIYRRRESAFAGWNEYAFRHTILREVTYESVLMRMRPVYHGLAANWLVEHASESAGEFLPLIADHKEKAGEKAEAGEYLRRAGEQSMRQHAHEEALRHLDRALELLPETEQEERFAALKARLQVRSVRGERQGQRHDLAALNEIARSLGDDIRIGEAALIHAGHYSDLSDYPNIIKHAALAIEAGQKVGAHHLESQGRQLWARALISMGDYAEAKENLERALDLAQQAALPQVEAESLRSLGMLAQYQGTPEEARGLFNRSLEIFQRTGDRRGESRALNSLGNLMLLQESYEAGKAYFDRVQEISREIGDRWGQGSSNRAYGDIFRSRADFSAARRHSNQAIQISEETGNKTLDLNARYNLAVIAMERGNFIEAGENFTGVLDLAQTIGNRPMEARCLGEFGRFFHRLGDFVRAMNYYQQGLLLFKTQSNRRSSSRVLAYLGLLHLDLENLDKAHETLQEALAQLEGLNYPGERAFVLNQLGSVHAAQGNLAEALEAHREALALCEEVDMMRGKMEPLAGIAAVHTAEGRTAAALEFVEAILAELPEEALSARDQAFIPGLEGTLDPVRLLNTCREVLAEAGDPRAGELAAALVAVVRNQRRRIADVDLKQSFSNNIRVHRVLLADAEALEPE